MTVEIGPLAAFIYLRNKKHSVTIFVLRLH
jgi:hypothetical protein